MSTRMRRPPNLHIYRDCRGKQRVYYRRPGRPRVPLPPPLYSEAFWTAYHQAAEASAAAPAGETPRAKVSHARPGSISALIERFYGSAEWKSLAAGSRETYRRILERFRAEHGDKRVATLTTAHVNLIMDQMADRPAAANNLRDRLNVLMKYAVADGWREDNPVEKAKRVKHRSRGYRTWSEEDIRRFREHWPLGTPQRLAMEILLHTGLRRSDAVRLGRQHVHGDHFVITTVKSQGRTELFIPIHPTLRAILASVPADHMVYITTAHGAARSTKAMTNWVKEAATAAGCRPIARRMVCARPRVGAWRKRDAPRTRS